MVSLKYGKNFLHWAKQKFFPIFLAIVPLFFLSCEPSDIETVNSLLDITIYTAGVEGNAVTSILLETEDELVLIDCQMLKAEAANVLLLIQKNWQEINTHFHHSFSS